MIQGIYMFLINCYDQKKYLFCDSPAADNPTIKYPLKGMENNSI